MNDIRTRPLEAMKHSFALAFDSGLQQRDIEKHHGREQSALRGEQRRDELDARRELRTDEGFKLDELRLTYHQDRNDLILTQSMDRAKLKAEWTQHTRDAQAIEIEDERAKRIKTTPDGREPNPEPGQQGKKSDGGVSRLSDQVDASTETTPLEMPDDYLDRLAAKQREINAARQQRQQEQDQGPERGD
jgi:hypothetical protein